MKAAPRLLLLTLLLVGGLGGLRHFSHLLPPALRASLASGVPWLVKEEPPAGALVAVAPCPPLLAGTAGEPADPEALPHGLLSVDGSGGSGYDRMVKKSGIWFPVYDQTKAQDGGTPTLAQLQLMIRSGPVEPIVLNNAVAYQAEAIGGTPPYHWTLSPGAETTGLTVVAASGLLTSPPQVSPIRQAFTLNVTDKAGTLVSAQLTLSVASELPLAVATSALPNAKPEEVYEFQLAASGGTPPYRWTATELPSGLALAASGLLTGQAEASGEFLLSCTVLDALEESATATLTLHCHDSLRILTETSLPAAAPHQPWQVTLTAEGGVPPYKWELSEPPAGVTLESATGMLQSAGGPETLLRLPLTVTDASENIFTKTCLLTVSDLLIAQAGRGKVGLAWQPKRIAQLLASGGLQAAEIQLTRDSEPIYTGVGVSHVDYNLAEAANHLYTLHALLVDGAELSLAETQVQLRPFSLQRGGASLSDPFADEVLSFLPLTPGGYGAGSVPQNVLGPPDGRSVSNPAYRPTEVASLHASSSGGGSIELAFLDNIVGLGPDEDITIFENVFFMGGDPGQRFMEPATVSVALFPGEWHRLPTDVIPPGNGQPINFRDPFYYARGLAGRNATTGDDPTNPRRSGGDSFDLNPLLDRHGITWIRYVRIQSSGDAVLRDDAGGEPIRHAADPAFNPLSGKGASGFDLDAVSAVHY